MTEQQEQPQQELYSVTAWRLAASMSQHRAYKLRATEHSRTFRLVRAALATVLILIAVVAAIILFA
jgi:hypothetical protein